jgi:hypothetical protein
MDWPAVHLLQELGLLLEVPVPERGLWGVWKRGFRVYRVRFYTFRVFKP